MTFAESVELTFSLKHLITSVCLSYLRATLHIKTPPQPPSRKKAPKTPPFLLLRMNHQFWRPEHPKFFELLELLLHPFRQAPTVNFLMSFRKPFFIHMFVVVI
jgi:hypothetical protein